MVKKKRAIVKKMETVAKKMNKPIMDMEEVEISIEKPKKMKKSYPKGEKAEEKMEKVMHEYKEGGLHSGSKKGPKVKSRKQAISIALNSARKAKKNNGK